MFLVPYEQLCRPFSIDEILSATQNFDEALVIGQGGFGKVYKATFNVENGATLIVAVKRLDSSSNQGAPEFSAEIDMLSKLRHCNLVSLIGYCNGNSEMILVYEFMPRGTLHDHLHRQHHTSLSWVQRLKISIGAARGLHYLHTGTGTQHGVIHRDVKSSNILLDEDYAAKISDFGLSKVGPINRSATYVRTLVKGTFGYLDPEYFLTGRLTRKSDVFAFGVVLLELLCGRLALDPNLDDEQCSLARWAHECIEEGKLDQIVDFSIKGQIFPKCLKLFVKIANRCLCSLSKERPTMAEVLIALESSLSLQEKFDSHVRPAGKFVFTRIMKGFFIAPEVNTAQSNKKSLYDNVSDASLSKADSDDHLEVHDVGKIQIFTHDLKRFPYRELESATRNFMHDTWLGKGKFGEVFKGWINENSYTPSDVDAGLEIVVKRLYRNMLLHLLEEKSIDLTFLRIFSHPNLVKLLGYCIEDENVFLVYEFMENGSLDAHLFTRDKLTLPWNTRVKIALGIAEGIYFLRSTQNHIDNYPLRLHKILLDRDFNAKLSGFEEAKLVHADSYKKITDKITDPLYFYPGQTQIPEDKGNIHAFGEVLIQILTGRDISQIDLENLEETMRMVERSRESVLRALDPSLQNIDDTMFKYAVKLIDLALLCLTHSSFIEDQALDKLRELCTGVMKCYEGKQPSCEASS